MTKHDLTLELARVTRERDELLNAITKIAAADTLAVADIRQEGEYHLIGRLIGIAKFAKVWCEQ